MCILCLWCNLAGHMFGERHCRHGGLSSNESEGLLNKGKQMHKPCKSKLLPFFSACPRDEFRGDPNPGHSNPGLSRITVSSWSRRFHGCLIVAYYFNLHHVRQYNILFNIYNYLHSHYFVTRAFYSNFLIAFSSFILPAEDCRSGSRKLVVFKHFS